MVHVFVSSEVNLNLNVSFLTLLRYLYANNFYMVVFMNRSPFGAGLNLVINQPLWQSYYLARTLYCSKFFVSSEHIWKYRWATCEGSKLLSGFACIANAFAAAQLLVLNLVLESVDLWALHKAHSRHPHPQTSSWWPSGTIFKIYF